jgi:hypothetical protein
MKRYLIILLLILWCTKAFATDYRADPSGGGTDCSADSPRTLDYAVEIKASSGDTGTYTRSNFIISKIAGLTITSIPQRTTEGHSSSRQPLGLFGIANLIITHCTGLTMQVVDTEALLII